MIDKDAVTFDTITKIKEGLKPIVDSYNNPQLNLSGKGKWFKARIFDFPIKRPKAMDALKTTGA